MEKTTADVLRELGTSRCVEYRRAWRREYRRGKRRIDYYPSRAACEVIDAAIATGIAHSQIDVIEQALAAWQPWGAEIPVESAVI